LENFLGSISVLIGYIKDKYQYLHVMNFDRASLNQTISSLEDFQPQQSGLQELDVLLEQIVRGGMGDSESAKAQMDAEKQFDQLTELAIAGNSEIFAQLVAAENNSRPENQPTLLMAAVMAGRTAVVKALVANKADVNIRIKDFFRFDAMEFAVDKENIEIVKILIDAGADLNWQDPGLHPVTKAISKNNVELLKILLDGGAKFVFETAFKPLNKAVETGNVKIIQILLDVGCEINATDYNGNTALIDACNHGQLEAIKLLITRGADLNGNASPILSVFNSPYLAQALASWTGKQSDPTSFMPLMVKELVQAGADVNFQTKEGIAPLFTAICEGYEEIVDILLEAGANPNLIGVVGMSCSFLDGTRSFLSFNEYSQFTTPLTLAIFTGQTKIVEKLLRLGADVTIKDKKNRLPIDIAIQEGHTKIIELLQGAGAKTATGNIEFSAPALLGAAKQGNLDILRSALAAKIDPNISELQAGRNPRNKTALMFAVERGHLAIVEHLIIAGADVNLSDRPGKKLGKTPLMYAAESDHPEIVKLLLRSGAVVDYQDKRGQTALYYAVLEQKTEAVKSLLEYGADPHKKNWDSTPFESATYSNKEIVMLITHYDQSKGSEVSDRAREEMLRSASFKGDLGIVRELIAQGVNLTAKDHNGWNALSYACAKGHLDITQVLLAAGADVNIKDQSGCTALSEAAYWGHLEIVNILLSAGAEVNGIDNEEGSIPLFKTIYFERTSILEVLLAAGANPSLRNEDGKTVLEFAVEQQKMEIVEVLQRFAG
jgi:ankyrin repeat protein